MNKKLLVVFAFLKKWRDSWFYPSRHKSIASTKHMASFPCPLVLWLWDCKSFQQLEQLASSIMQGEASAGAAFLFTFRIYRYGLSKLCVFKSEMIMSNVRRDRIKQILPNTLFLSLVGNKELQAGIYVVRWKLCSTCEIDYLQCPLMEWNNFPDYILAF